MEGQSHTAGTHFTDTLPLAVVCCSVSDTGGINEGALLWPLLLLGWVIVSVCNHRVHQGRLSILPTQGWEMNIHQPKCDDALQLNSKGRHGSFDSSMHVWVKGKTAWSGLHVPYLSVLVMSQSSVRLSIKHYINVLFTLLHFHLCIRDVPQHILLVLCAFTSHCHVWTATKQQRNKPSKSRCRSPFSLVCGQLMMIWNTVCHLPYEHLLVVARPHHGSTNPDTSCSVGLRKYLPHKLTSGSNGCNCIQKIGSVGVPHPDKILPTTILATMYSELWTAINTQQRPF